jgi:TRAP transporter 4TM/12TM fusion protein
MAVVPTQGILRDWLGDLVGADLPGRTLLTVAAGAIALALALLHALQAKYYFWPSAQLKNIHVNMSAVLVFLALALRTTAEQSGRRRLLVVLAAIAAIPLIYIHVEHDAIIRDRVLFPGELDQWIAILMLLTVFVAAWLEWGLIIPGMAAAGLLYGYFGNWFPEGLLFHSGISIDRLISYTSIPSFSGMLGSLTEESARTIFMFMLFAGVLVATGGTALIMKLSFAAVGHLRAGPAQIAVVSSALFGMISGSTVANVAAQGPYTIPTMRRCGFSREFAGAIEAVSSTGGQITPPVLGLTAFLIVGLTGIPYFDVMIATIFPAAIFYIYMMVSIHIEAIRNGIGTVSAAELGESTEMDEMSVGQAILEHAHIIVATFALFWLLSFDMPAGLAALYTCLLMIGGEIAKQAIKHWRRPAHAAREMLRITCLALVTGARSGAQVAIVVAVINVLVEMFVTTGLGQKMSHLMLLIADGSLWLLLVVAAVMCIILGCGVPTSAAYILVALLGAPALVKLGVPLLAAHLFVFFYANLSAITPPTALAALVAANIAGGRFLRTSMICMWLALPCFVLPFLFVAHPEIIGLGASLIVQAGFAFLALLSLLCATFIISGFMLGPLRWYERLLLLPAVFCLLVPDWTVSVAAYGLFTAVALVQLLGPAREFTVKSYAKDEPGRSLGPIGRYLVRRAEQGQTVD